MSSLSKFVTVIGKTVERAVKDRISLMNAKIADIMGFGRCIDLQFPLLVPSAAQTSPLCRRVAFTLHLGDIYIGMERRQLHAAGYLMTVCCTNLVLET